MGVGQIKVKIGNPAVGFCEVRMDDPGGPSGIECFQELEDRSLPVIDIFHLPKNHRAYFLPIFLLKYTYIKCR